MARIPQGWDRYGDIAVPSDALETAGSVAPLESGATAVGGIRGAEGGSHHW